MADPVPPIFISYAHADSPFVDQLQADLQQQGLLAWVDRRGLVGGQKWRRQLQETLERAQVLLVVLSPEAVSSEYVQNEYGYAADEGKLVIPLYYRPCQVPLELRGIQWIDFQHSYEQGLRALLAALQQQASLASPPQSQPQPPPSQPALTVLPAAPSPQSSSSAPLVGRAGEWAQLQAVWQRTADGEAHLVVLCGEAGVGKTRLAEELFSWVAQQGFSSAWARCYAVEAELAYAPVGLWLRADAIRLALSGCRFSSSLKWPASCRSCWWSGPACLPPVPSARVGSVSAYLKRWPARCWPPAPLAAAVG
jgi:hypothetical protein